VYYQATKLNEIKITDRGDILNVSWKSDTSINENLEVEKCAE
jgi:hypothetical protein